MLAARQHESVGAVARTRNDSDAHTFWTRTRFQVPTERATMDDTADILNQSTVELSGDPIILELRWKDARQ